MTLTFRRTLAILFGILFIVVAPLSVAYGRGYRFDTQTRRIRLTGVIFLAGWPKNVRVTTDDDPTKSVSFPATLRGLLPATHTVRVEASGYASQVFTLNVRSGQTTFAPDIQLYRANPFTAIRPGIPAQALLAPDGSAVAWLTGESLTIAEPAATKDVDVGVRGTTLTWTADSENILVQDSKRTTLAIVSRAGVQRAATYTPPVGDQLKISQLLNGRLAYTTAQAIPGATGWLLSDESSAWVLQPNGDLNLATRWGNTVIGVSHLGRQSIATVRPDELLVRNLADAQTGVYPLTGVMQASAGKREGEINLLTADGDLLQWVRGNVF